MSIADMQHFAQFRGAGEATVADRLVMLREHRSSLEDRMQNLQRSAEALEDKIQYYESLLTEQRGARQE